jgi:PleD family two-component response regulator
MPDENVFDVLPRIRKERPKLPIIVMSAQNTLLTAVNAADAGAFEYISKPFDLDDMTPPPNGPWRAPSTPRPPRPRPGLPATSACP